MKFKKGRGKGASSRHFLEKARSNPSQGDSLAAIVFRSLNYAIVSGFFTVQCILRLVYVKRISAKQIMNLEES